METETIVRLLKNSGFHVLGADNTYLYMEDPACILRGFADFAEYAWIIITFLSGMLLFGWAISMIRGAKNDLLINLRNLLIIFGTLSASGAIIGAIYGDDLFARGCRTVKIPFTELNELLDARKSKLSQRNADDLYEEFDIYDSGVGAGGTNVADMEQVSLDELGMVEIPDIVLDENPNSSGGGNMIPISAPLNNSTKSEYLSDSTPMVSERPVSGGASVSSVPTPSVTPSSASGAVLVSAASSGRNDVVYTTADGQRYKRTGGTRAWRNNNPGNIIASDFARRMGAIGQGGRFAVFPDEETGMRAIGALMRTDSYRNRTIADAISRYAPPHENDTAAYHRRLQKLTGLPLNKYVRDLSDTELSRVAVAIREIEGWRPGKTINI